MCSVCQFMHIPLTSNWVMIIRNLIRKPAEHLQEMQNSCQGKVVSSKTPQQIPEFKNGRRRKSVSGAPTAALQYLSLQDSLPICTSESLQTQNIPALNICVPQGYTCQETRGAERKIHFFCHQKQNLLIKRCESRNTTDQTTRGLTLNHVLVGKLALLENVPSMLIAKYTR